MSLQVCPASLAVDHLEEEKKKEMKEVVVVENEKVLTQANIYWCSELCVNSVCRCMNLP